jgi:hypothetical protein
MSRKKCHFCGEFVEVEESVFGLIVVDGRAHYINRPGPRPDAVAPPDDLDTVPDEVPDETQEPTEAPNRKKRTNKRRALSELERDRPKVDIVSIVAKRKSQEAARAAKRAAAIRAVQETDLSSPASES